MPEVVSKTLASAADIEGLLTEPIKNKLLYEFGDMIERRRRLCQEINARIAKLKEAERRSSQPCPQCGSAAFRPALEAAMNQHLMSLHRVHEYVEQFLTKFQIANLIEMTAVDIMTVVWDYYLPELPLERRAAVMDAVHDRFVVALKERMHKAMSLA